MLRNGITNAQKAVDATYKTHTAMKRGVGVVKTIENDAKITAYPDATTDKAIFVVDRENLATGINCAYSDRPDTAYDEIAEGEFIKAVPYVNGEEFYTDQYTEGATTVGAMLGVGTDGRWTAYEGGTKYESKGTIVEAGITYLVIDVVA
jgi:hypothetical protein